MTINNMPNQAEALYRTMHNCHSAYRENNQGIKIASDWLHLIRDARGEVHNPWTDKPIKILELGCGNGKLCNFLSEMDLDITGVDIVLSPTIYDRSMYKFIQHDLTEFPYPFEDNEFDYCINFDVMEHLPEDKVCGVLKEMARISRCVIVKIACSGSPPLHITVKSPGWWVDKLIENCPDFSWQLLRNYERVREVVNGNSYCLDRFSDVRPLPDDVQIVYAPLFYGKRGVTLCKSCHKLAHKGK